MFSKGLRERAVLLTSGILLLMLILGCGSSSGGGGIDYEGNREAAEVSADNAQVLAAAAYDSSSLEGPFGSVASFTDATEPVAATIHERPAMLAVAQVLETAVQEARQAESDALASVRSASVRAIGAESYTINGSCGGSASFSIEIDENSGVFAGDFDFDGYCADGTLLEGHASFRGRVDTSTNDLEYFTFSFSGLSGDADGEGFHLDGSLTVRVSEERDTTSVNMDLLFEDAGSGASLWMNDFTVSVTEGVADGEPYEAITFSGRLYHSVHGFVDIHTEEAFRIEGSDTYPSQGIMVLVGDEDAKIRMTVISNVQYQVEVDLDGDDVYDWGPEPYSWTD